jgi:PAS domain S-box-containing protein
MKNEDKLKELEEQYQTIIRTSIDGFWITDMQGHFQEVNDSYCRMIGYSRDELLKMAIMDIEAVEKPEETAARIKRIMATGGDRFESKHRHKDGRIIDIEVSVNYLKAGEGRLAVFLHDITKRKRTEEELKIHTEELEKMNRFMTGRELDMIEIKKEVNLLLKELGRPEKYKV